MGKLGEGESEGDAAGTRNLGGLPQLVSVGVGLLDDAARGLLGRRRTEETRVPGMRCSSF
jgi:hypothetical protein